MDGILSTYQVPIVVPKSTPYFFIRMILVVFLLTLAHESFAFLGHRKLSCELGTYEYV